MVRGACATDSVYRSGKTVPSTKASGTTIKRMARERSGTQMVITTKANSETIKATDTVCFIAQTEPYMKESGRTTFSTAKARLTGPTAAATWAIIKRAAEMGSAHTNGATATSTAGSG